MIKILHTADWHIGKSLYKHGLYDDIRLFFEQLKSILKEEEIDVLLVAGDIFDLANPSNRDKELYYRFLSELMSYKITVIITAGNHDSVRMLEAPKDLLKTLDIHIVGDGRNKESQIIPIFPKTNQKDQVTPHAIVLATPFLRDRDIRQVQSGEFYKDRVKSTREGIVKYYDILKATAKKIYPNIPIIAMGHLYMQGARLSDSEREIQIGNQAGIEMAGFSEKFDYMALGHIHKPQKIEKEGKIRYSGSPISLSFSERKDDKLVVVLKITDHKVQSIKTVPLDKYRVLKRITGTVDEIKKELFSFQNEAPLPAMVEIHAFEKEKDQTKILEMISLSSQESDHYSVVNFKINFENQENVLLNRESNQLIEDLQAIDVFRSKLDESIQDDDLKKDLERLFLELVESM